MIDGELVYKVNKSTIKKINVRLGPPVKASSLLGNTEDNQSPEANINNQSELHKEPRGSLVAKDGLEPEQVDLFPETEDSDNVDTEVREEVREETSQTDKAVSQVFCICICYVFLFHIMLQSDMDIDHKFQPVHI